MRFNSLYLQNKLAPDLSFAALNINEPTLVRINIAVIKNNVDIILRKPHPIARSN